MCASWTLEISVLCLTAWHFCAQASTSPPPQYHLSHAKLPWAQFMMAARPSAVLPAKGDSNPQRCVGVQESDVAQWMERQSSVSAVSVVAAVGDDDDDADDDDDDDDADADLPAALTVPGASVWLPAVPVARLVWKRHSDEEPFFHSKGCYRFTQSGTLESYGPLSCFQKCVQSGNRMPSGSVMLLQGERCICLAPEDFRRQAVAVVPSSCSIQCRSEDHLCGGPRDHFSVYDLPSVVFPVGKLDRGKCFTGTFLENGARLAIAQQQCSAPSVAICVQTQPQLSLASSPAITNYQDGRGYCSRVSRGWLPSKFPGRSADEFIRVLHALFYEDHRVTANDLHHRTFWLALEFKTTHRWTGQDVTKGREQAQIKRGAGAECSALTRNTTHVLMQSVACDTPLPFLTNCENGELLGSATKTVKTEDIQTATAVGLTGLICLVIFVVLALVLFVLKRSGRLHIRQKPAFHSTGEWDEESVAARVHREAYLADLQARLSQTRGLELKQLPATHPKPATTTPTPISRPHAGSRPVVTEYADPKPLRDVDFANVRSLPDHGDVNHYEMMSEESVTTATSAAAATTGKKSDGLVSIEISYQGDGIYSEPMPESEAADGADDVVKLGLQRVVMNGLAQDAGGRFLHPGSSATVAPAANSSRLPRPPRHDYEEATTSSARATGSIKRAHSDVGLLPHRREEAEDADSATYSVPFKAQQQQQQQQQQHSNGEAWSSHTSGEEAESIPAYCVSEISSQKMREEEVSGEEDWVPEAVGGAQDNEVVGSSVPHTVGPKGDLYARPAKSGVVVVSLKRAANKSL